MINEIQFNLSSCLNEFGFSCLKRDFVNRRFPNAVEYSFTDLKMKYVLFVIQILLRSCYSSKSESLTY